MRVSRLNLGVVKAILEEIEDYRDPQLSIDLKREVLEEYLFLLIDGGYVEGTETSPYPDGTRRYGISALTVLGYQELRALRGHGGTPQACNIEPRNARGKRHDWLEFEDDD